MPMTPTAPRARARAIACPIAPAIARRPPLAVALALVLAAAAGSWISVAHAADDPASRPIPARVAAARALAAAGDLDGAIAALDAIIAERPRATEALLVRGALRLRRGDPDGALTDASPVFAARADDERATFLAAHAHADAGRTEDARREYVAALKQRPRALADLQRRAGERADRGDWDGALVDYEGAVRLAGATPRPDLLAARGLARYATRQYALARADLDQAIAARPDYTYAHTLRGYVRMMEDDLDGALADFDAAVRLESGKTTPATDPWLGRSCVHFAAGRDEQALADLGQICKASAGTPHRAAIRAFARMIVEGREAALADYLHALALKKADDGSGLLGAGLIRALDGDRAGAKSDLLDAHRAAPDRGYAAVWLAALGLDAGPATTIAGGADWVDDLAGFAVGKRIAADLLAEAERSSSAIERRERRCEAWAVIGAVAEREGDPVAAREAYRRTLAENVRYFHEHQWARDRLADLGAD